MSSDLALAFSAFAIGIAAGLRSLNAPAVVSWAAHLQRLDLRDSRLAFLGSTLAAYTISVLGLGELVADKLPFVWNRTRPLPLASRILSGTVCGAALCITAKRLVLEGAILGALGAVNGAVGGFHARRLLVKHLKISDTWIALAEDAIAVGAAVFIVSRF
jgi:uncharacterized membrane protein